MNGAQTENISRHLFMRAASDPKQVAVFNPKSGKQDQVVYDQMTYGELEGHTRQLAMKLKSEGVGPGDKVALMVSPSLEFFPLVFALFRMGAVPVIIDPGMGIKNIDKCLGKAKPHFFLGNLKANIARVLFGWQRGKWKKIFSVGCFFPGARKIVLANKTQLQRTQKLTNWEFQVPSDRLAAILFTSGSTGIAKGVEYTHLTFQTQLLRLKELYRIQPGEVDLCTFPLFALFAPGLGMTSVVPKMDFTRPGSVDPLEVLIPLKKFKVTNLFGSPALIKRVTSYAKSGDYKLWMLKRVITAGAPSAPRVLEDLLSMLNEKADVFTPYGATESLPVASIGARKILQLTDHGKLIGKGVCVGQIAEKTEVKVIRITDEPINSISDIKECLPCEVGEILVGGDQVTKSYYNNAKATYLAKVYGPEGRIYHRMGDLGYFDEQGYLWFCGRKSHRLETKEGPQFTVEVESIFNTHREVERSALVGLGHKGQQTPVVCVELKEDARKIDRSRLQQELLTLARSHPKTKNIEKIAFHPNFPVDVRHNSKIFREKLAVWAKGQKL